MRSLLRLIMVTFRESVRQQVSDLLTLWLNKHRDVFQRRQSTLYVYLSEREKTEEIVTNYSTNFIIT